MRKYSVQRNTRISQKIAAEQDRDDTIKKALYQLVLRNKVLVMQFQEVFEQADDQERDVILPNQNLVIPQTTSNNH